MRCRAAGIACLALLLGVQGARAERASSPLGVELVVPSGWRWARDLRPKPTSVVCLEALGPEPRAQIVVNHIKIGSATEAEVKKLFLESLAGMSPQHDDVELPSGRFLRVDFAFDDKPRRLKQRWYVALKDQRVFQFVLSNVDEGRFEELVGTFDQAVASARFFEAQPEPVKPEPPKPEPAKPEPPKPAPEPAKPEPPKPAPVAPPPQKPEPQQPAPVAPPRAPADAAPVRSDAGNVLRDAKVVSRSSEYDPDHWAARFLVDGRPDRGWCSGVGSSPPHQVVLALAAPTRLGAVAFDDTCPVEADFAGVAAREVRLEASLRGPEANDWRVVLAASLVEGKDEQRFELPPGTEAGWLRLSVLSNHGHKSLTELMELRGYAPAGSPPAGPAAAPPAPAAPAPAAAPRPSVPFQLDKLRASRQRNGDPLGEGEAFRAGERVWVNLKPRGLVPGAEGKYWLELDLVLEDAQGRAILRREKVVEQTAPLPAPPLSTFVALHLDLPEGFPGGSYVVRVVARDRFGETSAAGTCPFTVKE